MSASQPCSLQAVPSRPTLVPALQRAFLPPAPLLPFNFCSWLCFSSPPSAHALLSLGGERCSLPSPIHHRLLARHRQPPLHWLTAAGSEFKIITLLRQLLNMRKIKSVKKPCGKGVSSQGIPWGNRCCLDPEETPLLWTWRVSLCEPGPLCAGVMGVGRRLLVEN